MKQMYFSVCYCSDICFSVIDEHDEEIANFHLAIHESSFGGEAIVILMENGEVLETHIVNIGIENEIKFAEVSTELSKKLISVVANIDPHKKITVSVRY